MKTTLLCDIQLGGSTKQYLEWNKKNRTESEFIGAIEKSLLHKAKTKPALMATRSAALIGVTYDLLDGDSYILDCICSAIRNIGKKFS